VQAGVQTPRSHASRSHPIGREVDLLYWRNEVDYSVKIFRRILGSCRIIRTGSDAGFALHHHQPFSESWSKLRPPVPVRLRWRVGR